jgi:1-acyl-sn-glycerol-3-phosphate acyltransferase
VLLGGEGRRRVLERVGEGGADVLAAGVVLERGAQVLVYPGGDIDTFKPWSERHTVKFGGRTGFVRLALRQQVPIVPVVSVGAHETFRVLTDGHRLAQALHLKQLLRLEVLPVFLCLPWGLWIGPYEMHLPLPSKIRLRVLPPIHFDLPPSAADDDDTVHALAEQVRCTMQAALDELARVHGYGVRARLGEAARAAWSARRGHADREVGGPAPATH